jgi:hypothetical protein
MLSFALTVSVLLSPKVITLSSTYSIFVKLKDIGNLNKGFFARLYFLLSKSFKVFDFPGFEETDK